MSDPNAATGTHSPGSSEEHPSTAGWVPPPAAPRAEEPGQTLPNGSTPGPQAPERGTESESTEHLAELRRAEDRSGLPRLPPVPGYDMVRFIGRGGMGVVYQAVHRSTGRTVALKIINPSGAEDDVSRERFKREVHALAALKHANIVPVYDAGEWHGFPYCAMEFAPGGTLSAHLDRIRRDIRGAVRLLAKVARAVAAMHAADVLHRDLKPLNILLGADDEPMVADFGLVRRVGDDSDLTYTGLPVGTRQYMAPEQTLGRRDDYTRACDIWALGVTIYEVLTGTRPFNDDGGSVDLYHRIRSEAPPAFAVVAPDVPVALEAVARHCLEKRPEDRYVSAADVAADLENWLQGRAVGAPIPVPPPPAPPAPVVPPAPVIVAGPAPAATLPDVPRPLVAQEPAKKPRRTRVLFVAGALILIAVGAAWSMGAFRSVPLAERVARGEKVALTDDNGEPTKKWAPVAGHKVTESYHDNYHWFTSTEVGLVSLADEPWPGPILVEAEVAVRYEMKPLTLTRAGVYVGRRSWSVPELEHESFVWFGVGPGRDDKKQPQLQCLSGSYWWESNRTGSRSEFDNKPQPWLAAGPSDPPRFARVAIEVRENEITGTVDGVRLPPVKADKVLNVLKFNLNFDRPKLPQVEFRPPAFGTGIGIYCDNATCTVRNLTVSKLTP